MSRLQIIVAAAAFSLGGWHGEAGPVIVDFEDVALPPAGFTYGGPGTAADFVPQTVYLNAGTATFRTTITRYSPAEYWTGFAFSNQGDTTTNSWTNGVSSFTGGGFGGGGVFAVAYWQSYNADPVVNLPATMRFDKVRLTNTTYTALTIRDGDPNNFSPGEYGPEDYLSVTFTGYEQDGAGGATTGTATFFLADFRDGNSLVVDEWTEFSLAALGNARSMGISFASSDVGEFGINTPTYVAIDDLTLVAVPEPATGVIGAGAAVAWILRRRTRSS